MVCCRVKVVNECNAERSEELARGRKAWRRKEKNKRDRARHIEQVHCAGATSETLGRHVGMETASGASLVPSPRRILSKDNAGRRASTSHAKRVMQVIKVYQGMPWPFGSMTDEAILSRERCCMELEIALDCARAEWARGCPTVKLSYGFV